MKLTEENYYSAESDAAYLSYSQLKAFLACEAAAMYADREPPTTAMLTGSYVDAWFEGTLDKFQAENPQIFKKDGSLKADYQTAEKIIHRVQEDEMFMRYMSGEKQVIMTGEIAGAPYKIKMDSYHAGKAIVDLKCMRDMNYRWSDDTACKLPFVEAFGYDMQAAIYREIVRQNTGNTLPYFLAVATKEDPPDIALAGIPAEVLDEKLRFVEEITPHIQAVWEGQIPPHRCGVCAYCRRTKKITEILDYRELGRYNQ